MTPEQEKKLIDVEKKLNEVHAAIVGMPKLGMLGIVPRLEALEEYKKKDQAFKYKVAGGLFVLTSILTFIAAWLKKYFGLN